MKDMKRVIQISLDIIVDCECDGEEYAEDITNELEGNGFVVISAGFHGDVTESYKEHYANLLEN